MIFGIRTKRTALGRFTSDKCAACKNGSEYAFIKKTKYLVIFGINLIPLKTTYESVCKQCDDISEVKTRVGKEIAKKEFSSENTKRNLIDAAKVAAALIVVAAAVFLPLLLIRVPVSTPQRLKDLVNENGTYNILLEDGTHLGTVNVASGEKTLAFYDKIRVLTGESGADGTFVIHEYYYEETDDETGETELVRMVDEPGVLEDRYKRVVRTYHYDVVADSLGYSFGVVDLSAIEYGADSAVYPFVSYRDDGEVQNYTKVQYTLPGQELYVTFLGTPDSSLVQTVAFEVSDIADGRTTKSALYQLDDTMKGVAQTSGLGIGSTADDLLSFISDNELSAIQIMTYEYYGDTDVVTSTTYTQPDSAGDMQTVTQNYTITEKDGYYIMEDAE